MIQIAEYRAHCANAAQFRQKLTNNEVHLCFDGFDLVVRGDYQPFERQTRDYPGCPADFDVTEVFLADSAVDVIELFDSKALAIAVLEKLAEEREAA